MGKKATHPEQQRLRKVNDRDLASGKTSIGFGFTGAKSLFADKSGSSAKAFGMTRKK